MTFLQTQNVSQYKAFVGLYSEIHRLLIGGTTISTNTHTTVLGILLEKEREATELSSPKKLPTPLSHTNLKLIKKPRL